ncbi:hypothetical protein [Neobacillus sp. Marseille-QA0830]
MKISSLLFKESPSYHEIPPIYEDLGLPDLASFIEQRFEFTFTMGKEDSTGLGTIRYYKSQRTYKILITEKITGIGPVKIEKLKEMLLVEAKEAFINNMEAEQEKTKVYHADFRRPGKWK